MNDDDMDYFYEGPLQPDPAVVATEYDAEAQDEMDRESEWFGE